MKKVILLFVFIAVGIATAQPQNTSGQNGNTEESIISLGFMKSSFLYPSYQGGYEFQQDGILFHHKYKMSELGGLEFSETQKLNFYFEGAFRAGFGVGTSDFLNINSTMSNVIEPNSAESVFPNYANDQQKFYFANLEIFSAAIAMDYFFGFGNGTGITPKVSLGFFSVGASGIFLDGSTVKEHGIVNIYGFPITLTPSVYINFGKSSLGIEFFIHTTTFVQYVVAPEKIFKNNDRGFVFSDDRLQRSAVMITYKF